jgi:hypothetical protein
VQESEISCAIDFYHELFITALTSGKIPLSIAKMPHIVIHVGFFQDEISFRTSQQ